MSTIVEPETSAAPSRGVAELRDGVRMSRAEFRRLRELHPEIKRVERIDGVVVMPAAAVRFVRHGVPQRRLNQWLGHYEIETPGVAGSDAVTVGIDPANDPEPDSLLFIKPEAGGRAVVTVEDYVEGVPELLAEVSGSTVKKDLGRNRALYENCGVDEYLVWLTEAREIRWLGLRDGKYQPLALYARGIVRSEVFPGLWLDIAAMLRDDMRRVFEVLNEGLASPEHATFVARLEAAMRDAAARRAEAGDGATNGDAPRDA